jgi:hypothetical protein
MAVSDGDFLKAVVQFTLDDGTIAQNVFWFKAAFVADQVNSAVLSAIEGYVEDIYNAVSAYLSNTFNIDLSYVHKMTFNPTLAKWVTGTLVGSILPTITHTNTDDPFPNQIAATLVANTTRPGSFGRKFLMGCVETMADGSELVSAAVTAMGNALNHYIADETVSGSDQLVVGVLREGVEQFLEFTDGQVNSIVGTQRRRKPGVGA